MRRRDALLVLCSVVAACSNERRGASVPAAETAADTTLRASQEAGEASVPAAGTAADTAARASQEANELDAASRKIIGFLQGQIDFGRIQAADSVTLHVSPEGGGGDTTLAREALQDRSNSRVRSESGTVYSFVPGREQTQLTTRVGRHLNRREAPLAAKFHELAELPRVGTTLLPPGAGSCLQSWNLTLVFDPGVRPPTLVAAIYDQWEW